MPKKSKVKRLKPKIKTEYLEVVYKPKPFCWMLEDAIAKIDPLFMSGKIDAIAFSGTSGAAIAYPLSFFSGIPLICVRKKSEVTHYWGQLEGCANARNYLIVDDFIESGRTILRIKKEIEKGRKKKPTLFGIYLYNESETDKTYGKATWRGIKLLRGKKQK